MAAPRNRSSLLRSLGKLWGPWGHRPEAYDAAAVEATVRALERIGRALPLFPVDVRGLEKVPPPPVMLVMNHSGGTSIPDAWGLMYGWVRHFGTGRPLHPLAHEMVVGQPLTGGFMERRGVLLAHRRIAREALAAGHDVLVLPGGDVEAWRPFRERARVDFDGRTGYARLAIEADVPVVPIAHAGAHETLVVLARGRRLARALRLPRLARAEIWPLHLSLPWGLALGPLPHIPWPSRLRYRVGEPLARRSVAAELDREVRASIQAGLDELYGGDRVS